MEQAASATYSKASRFDMVQLLGTVAFGGVKASRYRLTNFRSYTAITVVDEALSSFEVIIAPPQGREPGEAPVVIGLEGIGAPYQRLGYIVPVITAGGAGCILFETPFSGTRSLLHSAARNIPGELAALSEAGVSLKPSFMARLFEGVGDDFRKVRALAARNHGMVKAESDDQVALFGISFGCLLSSWAFMAEGQGQRLLGAIGHSDLPTFAGGLVREVERYFGGFRFGSVMRGPIISAVKSAAVARFGPHAAGAVDALVFLQALARGGSEVRRMNPLAFAGKVVQPRRVRYLAGGRDELVRLEDIERSASSVPGATHRLEPCLAHGYTLCGQSFPDLVIDYLRTELADWLS